MSGSTQQGHACLAIDRLIRYGLGKKLILQEDIVYTRNRLLALLTLETYDGPGPENTDDAPLGEILCALDEYALLANLMPEGTEARLRFEAETMGILTPRPSEVIQRFREDYRVSPIEATGAFYAFSQDTNYISRERTALDIRWNTPTAYGELDITINLSKPEKDPRDIAAARLATISGYPACPLCIENEGYAGRAGWPARQNHRVIPITVDTEEWGFQYSPYVYYNEHCIVLNREHRPMVIGARVFRILLGFLEQFPHYFFGSNADLPIVGGSILSHEHFQGGRYTFPMERAPVEHTVMFRGYEDVCAGIVRWPMSALRISHADKGRLCALAAHILEIWRGYSDKEAGVVSHTGKTPHNTITPIARMRGKQYELDLVLRNNITSKEHPLGVFHPHAELHNIKKENIGLIEVMGLAVLPARLRVEMTALGQAIARGEDIRANPAIEKHADWVERWIGGYNAITEETAQEILRHEIGNTFLEVLCHAGVFKRDTQDNAAFLRFLTSL